MSEGLSKLQEELGYVALKTERIFEEQGKEIESAHRLDKKIRHQAKRFIFFVNSAFQSNAYNEKEIREEKKTLAEACYELAKKRKLGRSSYLRFRALKEAIEALVYSEVAPYIYKGEPRPSFTEVLSMEFGERREQIFLREELAGSTVQAIAEVVGEISKGLHDFLTSPAVIKWQEDPTLQKSLLETFFRGLEVAELLLKESHSLGISYGHLIDKFFVPMIAAMERSKGAIAGRIFTLQSVLANRHRCAK